MRRPDLTKVVQAIGIELEAFCEDWIGYGLPPVSKVIAESGWSRNARATYCHRCGQSVGEGESSGTGCGACRARTMPVDGVVRLGSFSGSLRQWILGVKYRRWSDMGEYLGRELGKAIREAACVELSRAAILPMPMPWLRRAHRGIDHARTIAGAATRELAIPVAPILARSNGPTQLDVPKTMRQMNARRGLRVRRRWGGWPLRGLHIIIVDDVRTTGSSIDAAARLIKPFGPEKVVAAVLAIAESGRRERSEVVGDGLEAGSS